MFVVFPNNPPVLFAPNEPNVLVFEVFELFPNNPLLLFVFVLFPPLLALPKRPPPSPVEPAVVFVLELAFRLLLFPNKPPPVVLAPKAFVPVDVGCACAGLLNANISTAFVCYFRRVCQYYVMIIKMLCVCADVDRLKEALIITEDGTNEK